MSEERHQTGDATITGVVVSEYNSQSKPTRRTYDVEEVDGVVDILHVWTYENDWKLLRSEAYEGLSGPRTYWSQYQYDEKDRPVRRLIDFDGDDIVDAVDFYWHDDAGRLVRKQVGTKVTSYTYDDVGRLETMSVDWGADEIVDYTWRYIWEDGLVVTIEIDGDGDGALDDWWHYAYNEHGWVVHWNDVVGEWDVSYTAEGWAEEITLSKLSEWEETTRYEYDSRGRLLAYDFVNHLGEREFTLYDNDCPDVPARWVSSR